LLVADALTGDRQKICPGGDEKFISIFKFTLFSREVILASFFSIASHFISLCLFVKIKE